MGGAKRPYQEALQSAEAAMAHLAPHCDRLAIAGSIRRQQPRCGDVELVCIPTQTMGGLFDDEPHVAPRFIEAVNVWPKLKGEPTGRYTQRRLPSGLVLDLFMADAVNWGLQLAIRTGSAPYSHYILATGWVKAGYHADHGRLWRDGRIIPVPDEETLFALIGIPYCPPERREYP